MNFIKKTEFPLLSSNIDATREARWPKDEKYNKKSVVLTNFTEKIGIIGYTTPDTAWFVTFFSQLLDNFSLDVYLNTFKHL